MRAACMSRPTSAAIGYVAQEGALFPHLTVAENVAFGLSRAERKAASRTMEMLDLVALDRELCGAAAAGALRRRAAPGRPRQGACPEAAARAPRRAVLGARRVAPGRDSRGGHRMRWPQRERRPCSSPTTRPRRSRWDVRSPCCVRAGSCRRRLRPPSTGSPVDLDVARFVGDAVVLPGDAGPGPSSARSARSTRPTPPLREQVEVMIRPEQIRLVRGGSGGVSAEVVGHSFLRPRDGRAASC